MSSTFSNLKFELITTGEQTGTWGITTDNNIGTAVEQAIVGMATLTSANFTTNVATLTATNTNSAQNFRALCLVISPSSLSAAGTLNVPAIQKPYIIINNDSYAITVKVTGLTGVSVPAGKRTVLYNNGTDVGNQIDYLSSLTLGTALPIASGGTG
jgi:Asp-tRNA(Asn)/Glu-tRNA(Gln) amidotransferase A subunit family amidase